MLWETRSGLGRVGCPVEKGNHGCGILACPGPSWPSPWVWLLPQALSPSGQALPAFGAGKPQVVCLGHNAGDCLNKGTNCDQTTLRSQVPHCKW